MRDSQKLLRTIRSKRRRSRAVACCRRGRWHTIGVAEREVINIKFSLSLPQSFFVLQKMTAIAPLRCPDFVYAAWSAAQNRPLRNRCFLYPPQAAVAYVARQREPTLSNGKNIKHKQEKL